MLEAALPPVRCRFRALTVPKPTLLATFLAGRGIGGAALRDAARALCLILEMQGHAAADASSRRMSQASPSPNKRARCRRHVMCQRCAGPTGLRRTLAPSRPRGSNETSPAVVRLLSDRTRAAGDLLSDDSAAFQPAQVVCASSTRACAAHFACAGTLRRNIRVRHLVRMGRRAQWSASTPRAVRQRSRHHPDICREGVV
ncbi:conserved hypothetical protein [Xanthomonas phaseoli pv. phaseoli]|uniref:Uncharacterized protein n=1 Tax=Xanthomonas campestris pv. phaseoli TaxID=317013 RepID=A0A7Z7J512_XANCH|nr:conserved hypothetical protein [Xanthomonas phaseoli pv. phaseoli]